MFLKVGGRYTEVSLYTVPLSLPRALHTKCYLLHAYLQLVDAVDVATAYQSTNGGGTQFSHLHRGLCITVDNLGKVTTLPKGATSNI